MDIKSWISAFRLRTLPLALSGILMGTYVAGIFNTASWSILFLAMLTALFLQILSNLANDYGDFTKGTDNENRIGNTRALQSGKITPPQMLRAIILFVILSLISGVSLLYETTVHEINLPFLLFFILGIGAIGAAIKYTIGRNPYGYSGWGDLMVFIFFGPVAVFGTFLLHTRFVFSMEKEWPVWFASISIGLLSTGVLNTNNIRDIVNDAASGKYTIPVKIGLKKARIYHILLISGAFLSAFIFIVFSPVTPIAWGSLLGFIPMALQTKAVLNKTPSPEYNKLLKQLSLGTLFLVLLFILTELLSKILLVYELSGVYER